MSIFVLFALVGVVLFLIAFASRPAGIGQSPAAVVPAAQPVPPARPSLTALIVLALLAITTFKAAPPEEPDAVPEGAQPAAEPSLADMGLRWVLTVLTAVVILTGLLLWITWPALHAANSPETPFLEFMGSRFIGSAAAGLTFGVLSGYWFGSVLFRKPGSKASYPEIAVAVVMAILLLVGLAGQDALTQAFSRLTSVEVGGAKLGFEAGGVPRSLALSVTNRDTGRASSAQPDQSQGLALIDQLQGQIARDGRYTVLLATLQGYSGKLKPLSDASRLADRDLQSTIAPLFKCMLDFYKRTYDDDRLWRLLAPIASGMRRFALGKPDTGIPPPPQIWEDDFWTAVEAVRNEMPEKQDSKPAADKPDDPCPGLATSPTLPVDKHARLAPLRSEAWRQSPYLRMIIASMLAYGHQYNAAIHILEEYIAAHPITSNADMADISDVLQVATSLVQDIRLRGAVVTLWEEWLHGFSAVRPIRTIQKRQLDNLTAELADFEHPLLATLIAAVSKHAYNDRTELIDADFRESPTTNACGRPEGGPFTTDKQWRDALFLSRTLIAIKLNWIQVAMDQPDYFEIYEQKANSYVNQLLKVNIGCLDFIDERHSTKLEEILEAYARVTYANYVGTQKNRELTSDEAKSRHLEVAVQAIKLAETRYDAAASDKSDVADHKEDLKSLRLAIEATLAQLLH